MSRVGRSLGNDWSHNPKESCFCAHVLGTDMMLVAKLQS